MCIPCVSGVTPEWFALGLRLAILGAYPEQALVGFQGRGCTDVVPPNCCHSVLLEALLFQWPSIRRYASQTMVEHKPPASNLPFYQFTQPSIAANPFSGNRVDFFDSFSVRFL